MTTWAAALDAYEAAIHAHRAALDDNEVFGVPFAAPDLLGPLPDELQDRATSLLAASRDLELELAGALASVREDLVVARRVQAATAQPRIARFVDQAV